MAAGTGLFFRESNWEKISFMIRDVRRISEYGIGTGRPSTIEL
jgi:hypothetical protein